MIVDMKFALFVALWNQCQGRTTPAVHLRICNWLEDRWHSPDRKWLLMAFRSCGKSTLIGLFCTWLLWRNPDLRILVLAADLALARKMVRNVRRIIEKHPLTGRLVPSDPDQWASDRFTINRPSELRDPSMLAKGITTNITGTRADVIICDDVEVPKTCDSPLKREQMRERLLELDYILTPGGVQLYAGTPHSWYTIYADVPRIEIGEEEPFLKDFARLVLPVMDEQEQSIWPEKFTPEAIAKILDKTGPNHFASQMMCKPMNINEGRLDVEALQIYEDDLDYTEAAKQPVLSIAGQKMDSVSAYWDPSIGSEKGDRSIFAILYTDKRGEYWLHHVADLEVNTYKDTDGATQQCDAVARLVEEYHLPQLTLESNGVGGFLAGWVRNAMGRAGLICTVLEKVNTQAKSSRILKAFDPVLAGRKLHVHRSVLKTSFISEMQQWKPGKSSGHDDALDAVAGALDSAPVKITRVYGTTRQNWTGGGELNSVQTDFNVME